MLQPPAVQTGRKGNAELFGKNPGNGETADTESGGKGVQGDIFGVMLFYIKQYTLAQFQILRGSPAGSQGEAGERFCQKYLHISFC